MMDDRTVREVVADVATALVVHHVVPNSRATIDGFISALQITRRDLDAAAGRHRDGSGLSSVPYDMTFTADPPQRIDPYRWDDDPGLDDDDAVPVVEPEAAPEPEPFVAPSPPKRKPSRQRTKRTRKGAVELVCTGCGEWLPTSAFVPRSDRPGLFSARCRDCRAAYQRARRVSVATFDALNAISLKFVLDDDSNLVGLACVECGEPFTPDDEAIGHTTLRHARCGGQPGT